VLCGGFIRFEMRHLLENEVEFEQLAYDFGKKASPGDVVFLNGGLGVGKTTFVRAFVKGVGSEDWVNSPTYTLIHRYEGPIVIYHLDLYRLQTVEDVLGLDFRGFEEKKTILLIEWPDLVRNFFEDRPVLDIHIKIQPVGQNEFGREVTLNGIVF